MGKGKCTLEAQPVQRQTKKKGKRRGRQRGSRVASHTGPPGSPSLALQLPHLEKLLVNCPGKTDLATMPHPLLPRTAFPLPHPSLQLQRLSPSKELDCFSFHKVIVSPHRSKGTTVSQLGKNRKTDRGIPGETLSSDLDKIPQTLPEKGELVQLLGLHQKAVITFKNCKCVFIQGFHFKELVLLAHLEKYTQCTCLLKHYFERQK